MFSYQKCACCDDAAGSQLFPQAHGISLAVTIKGAAQCLLPAIMIISQSVNFKRNFPGAILCLSVYILRSMIV